MTVFRVFSVSADKPFAEPDVRKRSGEVSFSVSFADIWERELLLCAVLSADEPAEEELLVVSMFSAMDMVPMMPAEGALMDGFL